MSSHEHDKDRSIQHKKRKVTLPKIASPTKKNTSDTEFSDDTYPIEYEKCVNYRKDGKKKKNCEEKEAKCPDDTTPLDMEKGVSERKDDKNKKNDEGKEAECPDGTPPGDMEEGVSERKYDKNEKWMR